MTHNVLIPILNATRPRQQDLYKTGIKSPQTNNGVSIQVIFTKVWSAYAMASSIKFKRSNAGPIWTLVSVH